MTTVLSSRLFLPHCTLKIPDRRVITLAFYHKGSSRFSGVPVKATLLKQLDPYRYFSSGKANRLAKAQTPVIHFSNFPLPKRHKYLVQYSLLLAPCSVPNQRFTALLISIATNGCLFIGASSDDYRFKQPFVSSPLLSTPYTTSDSESRPTIFASSKDNLLK